MARKQDNRAARERKQKIFVAVAGVAFLALVALQGPKLLKQLKGSEPAATTTASRSSSEAAGTAAPASDAAAGTPVSASAVSLAATAPKNAQAKLAGVVIVREQPAKPGEGQLRSFTEFKAKDPFVQQVDPNKLPTPAEVGGRTGSTAPQQSGGGQTAAPTTGTGGSSAPATGGTTGGTTGAPLVQTPAPLLTMAMLRVNGKVQFVELKKRFPASDKAFVLRKLLRGKAVIGVAGGTFGPGQNSLTLTLGKAVTLVNTATGARYVIRLVYVGADAKQVTGFTAR